MTNPIDMERLAAVAYDAYLAAAPHEHWRSPWEALSERERRRWQAVASAVLAEAESHAGRQPSAVAEKSDTREGQPPDAVLTPPSSRGQQEEPYHEPRAVVRFRFEATIAGSDRADACTQIVDVEQLAEQHGCTSDRLPQFLTHAVGHHFTSLIEAVTRRLILRGALKP